MIAVSDTGIGANNDFADARRHSRHVDLGLDDGAHLLQRRQRIGLVHGSRHAGQSERRAQRSDLSSGERLLRCRFDLDRDFRFGRQRVGLDRRGSDDYRVPASDDSRPPAAWLSENGELVCEPDTSNAVTVADSGPGNGSDFAEACCVSHGTVTLASTAGLTITAERVDSAHGHRHRFAVESQRSLERPGLPACSSGYTGVDDSGHVDQRFVRRAVSFRQRLVECHRHHGAGHQGTHVHLDEDQRGELHRDLRGQRHGSECRLRRATAS